MQACRRLRPLAPAAPPPPPRSPRRHPTPAGLLTNFDCSCMWFADAGWARQALSLTPEYLRHHANDLDYKASA